MIKKIIVFMLAATPVAPATAFAQGKATVSGRVINARTEIPIDFATVTVGGTEQTALTDAAGLFAIRAAAGDTLRFSCPGYKAASHTVSKSGDHDTGDIRLKERSFEVVADRTTTPAKRTAVGTARVRGGVIDADNERLLKNVLVSVSDSRHSVVTDGWGQFAIEAAAGDTVRLNLPGYRQATHIVSRKGDHNIGDIWLEKKHAPTVMTRVTGRVVDLDGGKPLPYAVVSYPMNRPLVAADASGRFAITAEVGTQLSFSYPGYMWNVYDVSEGCDRDAGDIELRHKKSLDPDDRSASMPIGFLPGMLLVTGSVMDADTGKPAEGIIAYVTDTFRNAVTDAAGRFVIAAEAGDTVRFHHSLYQPATYALPKTGNHDIGTVELKKKTEE